MYGIFVDWGKSQGGIYIPVRQGYLALFSSFSPAMVLFSFEFFFFYSSRPRLIRFLCFMCCAVIACRLIRSDIDVVFSPPCVN